MRFFKKIVLFTVVFSLFYTPVLVLAQEQEEKTSVLFLGNSLFYYNSMDTTIFPNFCKDAGKNVEVTSITESGTTLYRMASEKTSIGKRVLTALTENNYDYVIINPSRRVTPFEYSVYNAEKQAAVYLNTLINNMGAKTLIVSQPGLGVENIPVYFMNEDGISSSTNYSLPMDRNTHRIYVENLCDDFCSEMKNAEVVRVGDAVENVLSVFPDFNSMYRSDNRHPSIRGSYLQAVCCFSAIFKQSPVGVGYIHSLTAANAVILQRAAAISVLEQDSIKLDSEYGERTLKAQLLTNRSVKLKWNEPKYADGYNIYRKTDSGSYQIINKTVVKEKNYTDDSLKEGHKYSYKIRAVHTIGNIQFESNYSNTDTVYTLSRVNLKSIKLIDKNTCVISFKESPKAVKYNIYRKKQGNLKFKLIGTTKKLTYTDDTLKSGNTYVYTVAAQGAKSSILSSNSNEKVITSLAKPKISLLSGKSRIKVRISAVKGASKYAVYIKKSNAKTYKLIKSTSKLNIMVKNLKRNTKYSIKVKAFKDALKAGFSSNAGVSFIKTK